jgi:hypothetical protein
MNALRICCHSHEIGQRLRESSAVGYGTVAANTSIVPDGCVTSVR